MHKSDGHTITGNIAGLSGNIDGSIGTDSGLLSFKRWEIISIFPQDMIIDPFGTVQYSYGSETEIAGMAFPTDNTAGISNIRSHLTLPTSKFLPFEGGSFFPSLLYPYVRYVQINNDFLNFDLSAKYILPGRKESDLITYSSTVQQPGDIYYPYTSGNLTQIMVFDQLPTNPLSIVGEPVGSLIELKLFPWKASSPHYNVRVLELGFMYELNAVGSRGIRQK